MDGQPIETQAAGDFHHQKQKETEIPKAQSQTLGPGIQGHLEGRSIPNLIEHPYARGS
jgi:hypothetical protein